MLYSNWRDEKLDILDKNLEVLYEERKHQIEENQKKYHNLPFDIDELEKPEEEKEEEDEPNPGPSDEEHFENDELEFEDETFLKVDIKRDTDEYVGKEMDMFKIQNRWDASTYHENIRKANIKQRDLLKDVMHKVFYNQVPFHTFITGPAGCGKSYLISILDQTCIKLYEKRGCDPSDVTVLKVAPTGKAAYNIQAVTLHHAFALPTKTTNKLIDLSYNTVSEYRYIFKALKLIIIDEISMVGYKIFNFVDQRLRQIMGVDKPFGNLSVIVFGDFRQLPPVADTPVYQLPKTRSLDHMSGNLLWEKFQIYELDEIMRQKDDMPFAKCLNNLADGCMTPEDIEIIESRTVRYDKDIPSSAIRMFYTNAEVDQYNKKKVLEYNTEGVVAKAYDTVTGKGRQMSKKALLQKVKKLKRTDTSNLAEKITIKVDAKYMLVYNLSTVDGLVNGAMGILRKIEFGEVKNSKKTEVKRLWIEFENSDIGKDLRNRFSHLRIIFKNITKNI